MEGKRPLRLSAKELLKFQFFKNFTLTFREKGKIPETGVLYEISDCLEELPHFRCGSYKDYTPEDGTAPQGKENELYKLADFEQLLSHYDARLAKKLNDEYLKEEWDFGQENLGSKKMFKDPPIICAEERMEMARKQRKLYKHLKKEIVTSQKMVYRVKAGFVRDRPLTAPDLSMYQSSQRAEERPEMTTKSAYDRINHRINSGRSRSGHQREDSSPLCDTSDRPLYIKPPDKTVMPIVSEEEIQETQLKKDNLVFDIETVEKRHRLQMEQTLNYYKPGFTEKMALREEEDSGAVLEDKPSSPRRKTTSEETINHLAYPEPQPSQCHSKVCDARYRGWLEVQTKKGEHFVLTSPTFENSYQGRLHKKLHLRAKSQAKKVTSEFAYRYTKSSELKKRRQITSSRPNTAPAVMQNPMFLEEEDDDDEDDEKDFQYTDSLTTIDAGYESCEDKSKPSSKTSLTPSQAWSCEEDSVISKSSGDSYPSPEARYDEVNETSKSSEDCDIVLLKPCDSKGQKSPTKTIKEFQGKSGNTSQESAKILMVPKKEKISVDSAPVPQMQHSKPKVVAVGGIGKISLLESISELQQWEDAGEEQKNEDSARPESLPNPVLHEDPVLKIIDIGEEKTLEDNLHLLSRRLSADAGTNKKKCSNASIEMPALTIEEKIEREKQARIRKQKRLQSSSLVKMGVAVFSPPRDRKPSIKSTSIVHSTSRPSVSHHPHNNKTHPDPHQPTGSQSTSEHSNIQTASTSRTQDTFPTKEKTPRSHSGVKKTLDKNKNTKNSSLQQSCKLSIRNNVTSTTDFEKENIQVQGPQTNSQQNSRKGLNDNSKLNCDDRKGSIRGSKHGRGKYDRLLKRMEGCISDVFATKLAAARPIVK